MDGLDKGEADSTGTLLIPDLEADREYMIRAEATGYNPAEETVKIEKNITEHLTIQMERNTSLSYLLGGLLSSFLLLTISIYILKSRSKRKTPKSSSSKPKPVSLFCPHCGSKVEKSWDLCPYCGADLKSDTRIFDENTRIY